MATTEEAFGNAKPVVAWLILTFLFSVLDK
jgi:hypothetical protein